MPKPVTNRSREISFFSRSISSSGMAPACPSPPKLKLMPLPPSDESPGHRLARIRRERGFTQNELAEKTGLVQTLVSDYEHGKLRLNADMILLFDSARSEYRRSAAAARAKDYQETQPQGPAAPGADREATRAAADDAVADDRYFSGKRCVQSARR